MMQPGISSQVLPVEFVTAQNQPISSILSPTTQVLLAKSSDTKLDHHKSHDQPRLVNLLPQTVQQPMTADTESDKRAIYRHPLFPLLALLLEKCELAAQTPGSASAESFDVDIHAFVQQQEQQSKPFLSNDPELDNLMLKAIQVLRIHLLELEKVTELCQDFCNRYISCLKGKLQSDSLLRVDSVFDDGEESLLTQNPGQLLQQQQQQQLPQQQQHQTPTVSAPSSGGQLNHGQLVSGGTVYQMVQTPQGIVAQPIQIQTVQPQQQPTVPVPQVTSASIIHGSTPLSQIGVPAPPAQTQNAVPTLSSSDLDDENNQSVKRGVLPKQATAIMKSWLFQHIIHPYPTEDEKRQIAQQTNLSLLQVNNWFINARRRILQPMLDSSDPTQIKSKKNKTQASRPMQRFWPESIANIQPQTSSPSSNPAESADNSSASPSEECPLPAAPSSDHKAMSVPPSGQPSMTISLPNINTLKTEPASSQP